jgi:tRNA (guanine-N7-)-methyltransferase
MKHPILSCYTLPWPVPWDDVFGAARPLLVEIGFGNADYLIALAEANPDCNVVGFEISVTGMNKAEHKIEKHRLANARAVYSTGETALYHLLTPGSVREFHINYPDPWFKQRHAGRRIIQPDTTAALASRLAPDGLLYLATDIADYATMSDRVLAATPGLENTLDSAWTESLPERLITTKYEAKGIREGRPGHYFRYRRTAAPALDVPVYTELSMPHVILTSPLAAETIAAQVEKQTLRRPEADITVSLLTAYYNPVYQTTLFEAVVVEPTIEQRIGLLLSARDEPDSYILKVAGIGHIRSTQGVHDAVGFVADWIASQHEAGQVTGRNIREP